MRVINTMLNNSDPFVVLMEDDVTPTPAFDVLWPRMLAELLSRLDEWDVVQTGGNFAWTGLPHVTPVNCSRAFVSINASTGAQMIKFNRSVLRKASSWLSRVQQGLDSIYNDIYFTVPCCGAPAGT